MPCSVLCIYGYYFRVSSFWKTTLAGIALRNHGCAVISLDDSTDRTELVDLLVRDRGAHFLKKPERVTHLLEIGNFGESYYHEFYADYEDCPELFPCLTKVTFFRNKFRDDLDILNYVQPSVQSVSFVDCVAQAHFVAFDPRQTAHEYWRSVSKKLTPTRIRIMSGITPNNYWTLKMKFERLDIVRDDIDHNAETKMFVVQKTLDGKSPFWPYPDEQLQWLLRSLDNLDVMSLQAVEVAEQWQNQANDAE